MTTGYDWPRGRVLLMGVVNVTPDSFSDGGQFAAVDQAVAHGCALAAAGADILDVGGESSRPGAAPVPAAEELRRVLPVIEQLTQGAALSTISIDTTKAVVAEQALAAGARIVNDISALRFDERMPDVVRAAAAGVILMHMQGTPRTMQLQPQYTDVVAAVRAFLEERIAAATARGIHRRQIAIDPGIGFGKTVDQNLKLLANLQHLQSLACPVVVGTSRKSFIGQVTGRPVTERGWGTAATVAWAVAHGAAVVRVHEVAAMRDVVRMIEALRQNQ